MAPGVISCFLEIEPGSHPMGAIWKHHIGISFILAWSQFSMDSTKQLIHPLHNWTGPVCSRMVWDQTTLTSPGMKPDVCGTTALPVHQPGQRKSELRHRKEAKSYDSDLSDTGTFLGMLTEKYTTNLYARKASLQNWLSTVRWFLFRRMKWISLPDTVDSVEIIPHIIALYINMTSMFGSFLLLCVQCHFPFWAFLFFELQEIYCMREVVIFALNFLLLVSPQLPRWLHYKPGVCCKDLSGYLLVPFAELFRNMGG